MTTDKVMWKDGLFVQPHHFQQFERFLLSTVKHADSARFAYGFGFTSLKIDTNSLYNGTFALTEASGIMPDGTDFAIPYETELPLSRSIREHFSPQTMKKDVFLALPLYQEAKALYAHTQQYTDARFRLAEVLVTDEIEAKIAEKIEVAKLNFIIRFENEPVDSYTLLPIARLIRNTEGDIRLDESFIPPILRISASTAYVTILQALLSHVYAKRSQLLQSRKQGREGFVEFGSDELTTFGLLQAISTYLPLIDQYVKKPSAVHPYEIHGVLTKFCGSLQTFLTNTELLLTQPYEHEQPAQTLSTQFELIKNVLQGHYAPRCITLKITKTADSDYLCILEDKTILESADLYVGVYANAPAEEFGKIARLSLKLCAPKQLGPIKLSASQALPLNLVINPPTELATKPGFIYLNLVKEGSFWQQITASQAIAFYFPSKNYPDLKFELLAIKKKSSQ